MIRASNLSLSFGSRSLFDSLSFDIKEDQRIGLIGANGSGKSTLLEAIIGHQQIDNGVISINKGKKIAYLSQDVVLASELSILEETMTAFEELYRVEQKLIGIEPLLSEEQNSQALSEYSLLHAQRTELNPDFLKAQAKKMLLGLGFISEDLQKPVTQLSIGWRMRIVLAKLLLQNADFYLFDEPTNHLDIFAKDWFLDFLKMAPFGFMLVCHERYFLDAVCDHIFELENAKGIMYNGNYTHYEQQKEQRQAALHAAYTLQQKEIKQKQATIDRFKASASRAKQAQSMIKQLDKLERIIIPSETKTINFEFPSLIRSGTTVLKVENVGHTFEQKTIFHKINFEILRGQKVALVASNGGGKSTLLHLISKKLPLQQGTITFGHNVTFALFDQDQNKALNMHKSILDNIQEHCAPGIHTATIRSILGAFLFSGDDVNKKVSVLSGGEKNRVGMVKTLLQNANFLLLDEPTNHLDIDAKKVLRHALSKYEGTILFVSHDRAFLNNLATRILELTPHGIMSFEGNYDEYLYYKKYTNTHEAKKTVDVKENSTLLPTQSKNNFETSKKIKSLEKKIDQLEKEIIEQELQFASLSYGTPAYHNAEDTLKNLKEKYNTSMKEWELLLTYY